MPSSRTWPPHQSGGTAGDLPLPAAGPAQLPYGPGASLRHVFGSAQVGGYEWQTAGGPVRNGITALELDGDGAITRLTSVWDVSRMSDAAMMSPAALSIEE